MAAYILRRLLLMIPTLFGIMAVSFAVIQFAPGGPVEQVIAKLTNQAGSDRLGGGGGDAGGSGRAKFQLSGFFVEYTTGKSSPMVGQLLTSTAMR